MMEASPYPKALLGLCLVLVVAAPLCGESDETESSGDPSGGPAACSHPSAVGDHIPTFVNILTQADVAMVAGCRSVEGLNINNTTEVHDLDGLESLREIRAYADLPVLGNLSITYNSGLVSIDGLRNIERSEYEVYIFGNPELTQVNLPALTVVGDDPSDEFGRGISVFDSPKLTLVDLGALNRVSGDVLIAALPSLTEIRLASLTTTGTRADGQLTFAQLGVETIQLPSLQQVLGGGLSVNENPALTTLALPSLTQVDGIVIINANAALPTLDLGLLGGTVLGLGVTNNGAMTSIAIPSLSRVVEPPTDMGFYGGNVTITDNLSLSSISLGSLVRIDGSLDVCDNPALPTSAANALEQQIANAEGFGSASTTCGNGPN